MPSDALTAADAPRPRHTVFDDVQALVTGTLFVALGLVLFRHAGLMTGGTAGLALIGHYASGERFGAWLFAINLPFYVFAWRRMGAVFTLKTFVAVALLSAMAEVLPQVLVLQSVQPAFAALGGGLMMGTGMLILFRHRASLGGMNVLVLWLQERFGWRAGVVQLALDACILVAALPWVEPAGLALSVAGAAAMNVALALNHRPDRYVAV
jgi:uncharacterized membrane-anchored protein YitT (DUF2179 family)